MVGDQLPKGIIPIVLVNGKDYHWKGLADLPKGYNVIGEISGISEKSPCEELQLMAGFEATGTVCSSDQGGISIFSYEVNPLWAVVLFHL